MNYTIKNDELSVTVSTLGAELQSVKFHGKERLWQNENGEWAGHSPNLFPVCGACYVQVNGVAYPMPKHGFGPILEFVCEEATDTSLVFTLTDSAETRKYFPFAFVFKVAYSVEANVLKVTYITENPSDEMLYAATGAHESYVLDEPLSAYKLVFPENEHFLTFDYDETKQIDFGYGKELPVPDDLLQNSETLQLHNVNSRSVSLVKKTGERIVDVAWEGYKTLFFWRPTGAPQMICIEPWGVLYDPDEPVPYELSEKENINKIPPHESLTEVHTVTYY